MAFEIHRREFFDPENDADPEGRAPGHLVWRVLSIAIVAAIVLGLAYLFIGSPAGELP